MPLRSAATNGMGLACISLLSKFLEVNCCKDCSISVYTWLNGLQVHFNLSTGM